MNRQRIGNGVAWVKSNFSSNRASTVIDPAENFLDNMNFAVIGRGSSSYCERENGDVVLNENIEYQKHGWLASLYYIYLQYKYYIYLQYKIKFHRSFFPTA